MTRHAGWGAVSLLNAPPVESDESRHRLFGTLQILPID
jgi:hypothetical protein